MINKNTQINNQSITDIAKQMKENDISKLIQFLIQEIELLEARVASLEKIINK